MFYTVILNSYTDHHRKTVNVKGARKVLMPFLKLELRKCWIKINKISTSLNDHNKHELLQFYTKISTF